MASLGYHLAHELSLSQALEEAENLGYDVSWLPFQAVIKGLSQDGSMSVNKGKIYLF